MIELKVIYLGVFTTVRVRGTKDLESLGQQVLLKKISLFQLRKNT